MNKKKTVDSRKSNGQISLIHFVLLLGYLAVPVLLNGLEVLDASGPKFLSLGIMNLISLAVFISDPNYRARPELKSGFFKTTLGLIYSALILITLLSFFKAINLTEALMNYARIVTVFASAYMLFVILTVNKNYLFYLAVALNIMLIFDSSLVVYNIFRYISRDVATIMDIKMVYSHKNIISAAMFVKLPAAVYLIFFSAGWRKWLGYASGLMTLISILLLSARAFYIGLVLLFVALFIFAMIRFFVAKEKNLLKTLSGWAGILILAIVAYTLTQMLLFPKKDATDWNKGIIARLSSIKKDESSANARLASWGWSLQMIRENPLMGVGTGNWKVAVLKLENPVSADFSYSVKSHNDFLETTTETGVFGGLSFIAIFVVTLVALSRLSLKAPPGDRQLQYFFLPAFGILAYSVDAFFNFPADRPEMQALFALNLALAAVYMPVKKREVQGDAVKVPPSEKKPDLIFYSGFATGSITLIATAWLLWQTAVSLHYQLLARIDNFSDNFTHPASFFLEGFPSRPNLTCLGEPIAVNKARYLINEERFREAISLLKNDRSSPYDSRCDYYLSLCYDKLGKTDSAIFWGLKAYEKQPLYGSTVMAVSSRMYLNNRTEEGMQLLDKYLTKIRNDRQAWMMAAKQHFEHGDTALTLSILDSTARVAGMWGDTAVLNQVKIMQAMIAIGPNYDLFEKGRVLYRNKQYAEALKILDEFIAKRSSFVDAFEMRAYCQFFLRNFPECLANINQSFNLTTERRAQMLNLRGICYIELKHPDYACRDFLAAKNQGLPEAANNYNKFCNKK